ncbi:MAG: Signal transduction histidine-protein kinase BaeS [Syntrophorhabdus sp. PtaU1.Bin058]|nr:MAG: Signal transduction histidine-protein kinase BaeS [Syntrophorhabdus sp. PtaU1.Bin058]
MKIRMKLSYKFFLAFLLTFVALTISMIATMQFYAYREFSKYVRTMEMLRLDEIATVLDREYRTNHGWEQLKDNIARWQYLLRPLHPQFDFKGPHPVPPDLLVFKPKLPHPKKEVQGLKKHAPSDNRPVNDALKNGPPYPPFIIEHRLTLFDAQKQPVVGPAVSAADHTLKEIAVDGNVVGWLGLKREERLSHPLNLAFIREQSNAFYTIGAIMLLLASVVAFFMSRHLLAPIQQLAAGTRALSSLRFDTRIDAQTGDELGQLVSDFNMMLKTLERYEHMRKQWISDISHELRTPLSILQGEIEAIQDGIRKADRQVLESLHSEVLYLNRIVTNLHDLSMADSGAFPLKRQPVNPLKVLAETLNRFRNRFSQEQITVREDLKTDQGIVLRTDPTRLEQLFSNLFENVLRYADKPGVFTIRQAGDTTNLELYFEDSGPGVPEQALEYLFDRLYRVDFSRTRAKGGSGLGLAICKAIVEAHDGKIAAYNVSSGGLGIHIVIPIVQGSQSTERTKE